MNCDKKVYILMATYNGEKFIAEQIDSILNQTYQNWKLIIHDDGSNDLTIEIIKKYRKEDSERILLIEDGVILNDAYKNFFHLLTIIDNEFDYIMFSDQDDVWLPSRVSLFCNCLLEHEIKNPNIPMTVFSDAIVVGEHLELISASRDRYVRANPLTAKSRYLLAIHGSVYGCAMIFNKLSYVDLFPLPKFRIAHDKWVALTTIGKGENIFLDKATMLYRQHQNNFSGVKKNCVVIFLLKSIYPRSYIGIYRNVKDISGYFYDDITIVSFLGLVIQVIWLRLTSSFISIRWSYDIPQGQHDKYT